MALPEELSRIPMDFLQRYHLLPLGDGDDRLRIGYANRESLAALEDIRLMLDRDIEPVPMSSEELQEGLRNLMVEKLDTHQEQGDDALVLAQEDTQDLMTAGRDAPVISLVNTLLLKALGGNASDIHIEPYEDRGICRMRVDGVLQEAFQIPKARMAAVVARIKVMSRLNLAESRLPQDGRIKVKAGDRTIDLRVSVLPTLFGERVVMRLLRGGQAQSITEIGLMPEDLHKIRALADHPHGLLLSTGPTGSGKTTTLYGLMLAIQAPHRNMITIEDPVEYQVARIGQIQVNPRIGLTFANGLRAILRQDPDVIMVGEIRDSETADIAIHSALTGHLVLSTLHTNDAPTAVSRLLDMGIVNYLISSSLLGVVAQRLVRKLCTNCKRQRPASADELQALGLTGQHQVQVYEPGGCPQCLQMGYKGRTGLFEVMVVDDEIRRLIVRSGEASVIRQAARQAGMKTLMEDGTRKVLSGITSVEEVLRATRS